MHSTNNNNNNNLLSYEEIYDIPKRATPVNYDLPKAATRRIPNTSMSILPPHLQQQQQQRQPYAIELEEDINYDVPRSSTSTASSSNRSSLAVNYPDYDVPKRHPIPVNRQSTQQQQQQPIASTAIAATPPTLASSVNLKMLPLNLASALETLTKLHTETINVITRILSFIQPNWRQPHLLEPQLMEIKLTLLRLRNALQALTEFGEGALANAQSSEDGQLAQKLRPLVLALKNACHLIGEANEAIELQGGWTLKNLARLEATRTPDSLDQVMACAQPLTEDVRQLANFIHANAQKLFKPAASGLEHAHCIEDYDYVFFESKDTTHKKDTALREHILPSLKEEFDCTLKTAENYALKATTPTQAAEQFVLKDKLLLRYYAGQICTHMYSLRQAIASFLETLEFNKPPKYFIAYGKFVVVSAHNLVTIGDIVHRNICKQDLREKILTCTNALTDALRNCVNKSTKAAAHFPSVIAVQEMVNAVEDISHLATQLKTTMLQAVQLTF